MYMWKYLKVQSTIKYEAINHACIECYLGKGFQYLGSIFPIYTKRGSVVRKPWEMFFSSATGKFISIQNNFSLMIIYKHALDRKVYTAQHQESPGNT